MVFPGYSLYFQFLPMYHIFTGKKSSVRSTPKSGRSSKNQSRNTDKEQSFTKVVSPRTMMERLPLGDSLRQEADGQEVQTDSPSLPLSARSDRSNASSCHTLTDRSNKSSVSQKSIKSVSSAGKGDYSCTENVSQHSNTGRKTPTDLLVEEIMGEGKILSPFNSGMFSYFRNVYLRTSMFSDLRNNAFLVY